MTKILIADDERDIRDLITFTLRFAGYEVIPTANGEEAFQTAVSLASQADKPELILMDVRMPKMTGYEACENLKKNKDTKDIPVVFLSAKGQESEVRTGLDIGAEEYILKPFSPDQLIERIKVILSRKR